MQPKMQASEGQLEIRLQASDQTIILPALHTYLPNSETFWRQENGPCHNLCQEKSWLDEFGCLGTYGKVKETAL